MTHPPRTVCEVTAPDQTTAQADDKFASALVELLAQRTPQARRAAFEDALRTITRRGE